MQTELRGAPAHPARGRDGMVPVLARNAVPSGAIAAIGVLLLGVLLSVATLRLSGTEVRNPDAPAVQTRSLRFEDTADGAVAVIDARSGLLIEKVQGEAGFLRGSLRALTRERAMRRIGSGPPFELVARADGRLTLLDPATGERLDLESFGPTNAAVYARLLQAPARPLP